MTTEGETLMDVLADYERECAEAARDEAIDRVEANANDEWLAKARQAVLWLAHNRDEWTTDDMWSLLDGCGVHTSEPRAMGAVMRWAARSGLVSKTDRVVNSRRAECHARPVAVWKSNQNQNNGGA